MLSFSFLQKAEKIQVRVCIKGSGVHPTGEPVLVQIEGLAAVHQNVPKSRLVSR